jgi:hypothetical protein
MNATAHALLEAHIRHVMQHLSGDAQAALVDEETSVFYDWLAARPINTLVDEVRVRDFLLRNIYDIAPSERLLTEITVLATHALQSPLNGKTRLEELLNVREYDLIVDRLISLEEVRHTIVHAFMQNPSVTQLLSDLVYNGVKNYLAENSSLAKKVPGVSSLMRMGRGVMERVGADDALEGALKSYVARNTRATMEMSERLVSRALEAPKLKTVSRQFWLRIKSARLDRITRHVQPDHVEDVVTIGNTLWNHFRQTTYARELLNELVHAWFESWGQEPAVIVLEGLALDKTRLQQEVRLFLGPLIAEMEKSGYLEARVRAHLERFYASPEASAVLGG